MTPKPADNRTLPMKLIFFWVVLTVLAGCGQSSNQSNRTAAKEAVRTDVEPIEKRLFKLGPLQSVWWTSTRITTDSIIGPPSHPAYKVLGFAQLEKGKSDELSQDFQWERMPHGWKPGLTVTNLNFDSAEWSQSAEFTKGYKPQLIPGKLFFEHQKGVVYFDLEIE
jgi:hypothetical protein